MPQRDDQTDRIRMYIDLIQLEKQKLQEALEAIEEYAERLREAAGSAQQVPRIGRR